MSQWNTQAGRIVALSLALLGAAAAAEPPAQVAVSPPRLELSLDGPGRTESLHVMNLSDKATRVKISVANWDLDERNEVRVVPPTEQSLDQWLIVNPLEATIAPHDQQTIRLAVRPRVTPAPGEHRAIVYIEQQPDATTTAAGESGIGVRYRMGVAIYGYAGEIVRSGAVHGVVTRLERDGLVVGIDVESNGNAYVRPNGRFAVWPRAAYPGEAAAVAAVSSQGDETPRGATASGRLPELPVLAGTRRTLETRVARPKEGGEYVVVTTGALADAPYAFVADLVAE